MLPSKEGPWGTLLGVEHIWQGYSWAGMISNTPGKSSQYFNPARDYVCEVSEFEEDTQAHWQEDKDWLKDVPADGAQTDSYHYESRNGRGSGTQGRSRKRSVTAVLAPDAFKWWPLFT